MHVPWCMSGSLTSGFLWNVTGIPGACTTRNFTYLLRGPLVNICLPLEWPISCYRPAGRPRTPALAPHPRTTLFLPHFCTTYNRQIISVRRLPAIVGVLRSDVSMLSSLILLSSTLRQIDPDTAYVVCISVSLGFPSLYALRWRQNGLDTQITSPTIVYSTVYSDTDQRKHQSSTSLAFVRGIHRGSVNSPHKWPVTRKMSPFDDVIMGILIPLFPWSVNRLSICWISKWSVAYYLVYSGPLFTKG